MTTAFLMKALVALFVLAIGFGLLIANNRYDESIKDKSD